MAEMKRQPADLKPERIDTYKEWQAAQKIPVIRGFFVEDINTVELVPWDLKGAPTTRMFAKYLPAAKPMHRSTSMRKWCM